VEGGAGAVDAGTVQIEQEYRAARQGRTLSLVLQPDARRLRAGVIPRNDVALLPDIADRRRRKMRAPNRSEPAAILDHSPAGISLKRHVRR